MNIFSLFYGLNWNTSIVANNIIYIYLYSFFLVATYRRIFKFIVQNMKGRQHINFLYANVYNLHETLQTHLGRLQVNVEALCKYIINSGMFTISNRINKRKRITFIYLFTNCLQRLRHSSPVWKLKKIQLFILARG